VRATGALATRSGNTDPLKSELLARDARGGFSAEVQAALKADPTLAAEIAARLLRRHFPDSVHDDVLNAVGLDLDAAATADRKRDPRFRQRVLTAYEWRCAVCGLDVRLGSVSIVLEAAHIRWHQAGGPMSEKTKAADVPRDEQGMVALLKRAQAGDASTLPALRELLRRPEVVEAFGGNMAGPAEASLISAAAGDNLAFREALLRKMALLRAELQGASPTPLERLLVERVVACWLQVQDADVRCAQAKNPSLAWGDYLQRRMDRAHKRFLTAARTLALVRRLALPVLVAQVNIADKQVNKIAACQP
jgi:hypothetical protein